jgi:hypothetical protein
MRSTGYSRQIFYESEFPEKFLKNPQISNFMKVRSLEAELLHPGGPSGSLKPLFAILPMRQKCFQIIQQTVSSETSLC